MAFERVFESGGWGVAVYSNMCSVDVFERIGCGWWLFRMCV
jgi:hypothetical protein